MVKITKDKQGNIFIGGERITGDLEYDVEDGKLHIFNKSTNQYEVKNLQMQRVEGFKSIKQTEKEIKKIAKTSSGSKRTIGLVISVLILIAVAAAFGYTEWVVKQS